MWYVLNNFVKYSSAPKKLRIIPGTLAFALAVFINFIELSSQAGWRENRRAPNLNLKLETFPRIYAPHLTNVLKKIVGGFVKLDDHAYLVSRDNIIIGWNNNGVVYPMYDTSHHMIAHIIGSKETYETVQVDGRWLGSMGLYTNVRIPLGNADGAETSAAGSRRNRPSSSITPPIPISPIASSSPVGSYGSFNDVGSYGSFGRVSPVTFSSPSSPRSSKSSHNPSSPNSPTWYLHQN